MLDAQKAMRLALNYLQARAEFEAKVKSLQLEKRRAAAFGLDSEPA